MSNIFDYVQMGGELCFKTSPLNELDSLIFSRLCYLSFDRLISENVTNFTPIKKISEKIHEIADEDEKIRLKDDFKLISEIGKTRRFENVGVSGYVEKIDVEKEEQFSAVVFKISQDLIYIAFRGTDNTLVGWKENFNMLFMNCVPSQKDAVKYLEKVAEVWPRRIIVGGHSKGGNIAAYSAAFCSKETQNRIVAVFNNDGPGFNEEVIEAEGFMAIKDRTKTFVPKSTIIGMIMERKEDYKIVKSRGKSLIQHNLYLWETSGNRLVYEEEQTSSSVFVDHTIKTWLGEMNNEELKVFCDVLFSVVCATDAYTAEDLGVNWYDSAKTMLKSYRSLDGKTSQAISAAMQVLFKSAQASFGNRTKVENKI